MDMDKLLSNIWEAEWKRYQNYFNHSNIIKFYLILVYFSFLIWSKYCLYLSHFYVNYLYYFNF